MNILTCNAHDEDKFCFPSISNTNASPSLQPFTASRIQNSLLCNHVISFIQRAITTVQKDQEISCSRRHDCCHQQTMHCTIVDVDTHKVVSEEIDTQASYIQIDSSPKGLVCAKTKNILHWIYSSPSQVLQVHSSLYCRC